MNEQLANFFVSFTTEGLEELKSGIDDINNKLDDLDGGFSKSTKGMNGMLGGLTVLLGKLGLFGSAIAAVAAGVANAFDVGERAVDLRNASEMIGVDPAKLETMGIVWQKYGGNIQTATAEYKNFLDTMTQYSQAKIPDEHREMMARYGQYGLNIQAGMNFDQYMQSFNTTFRNLEQAGKYGEIAQIAGAFKLNDSTQVMLMQSQDQLREEVERAKDMLVLSKEEVQANAEELRLAKQELKATWDMVSSDLIPLITDVLNVLKPILEALKPIASWALKQIGGLWNTGKNIVSALFTDKTLPEAMNNIRQQDDMFGATVRAVDAGVDYMSRHWAFQNADAASKRIGSGNYTWDDINALNNYLSILSTDRLNGKEIDLTDAQLDQINAIVKEAAMALAVTSNPINTTSTSNTSTDNRQVNVGAINVHGDTGSVKGIKNALGSVVRDEMGQIIMAGSTARGGV